MSQDLVGTQIVWWIPDSQTPGSSGTGRLSNLKEQKTQAKQLRPNKSTQVKWLLCLPVSSDVPGHAQVTSVVTWPAEWGTTCLWT